MANNDSRKSLQARYADHRGYVAAVTLATERAMKEGFLLPADAKTLIQAAEDSAVLK